MVRSNTQPYPADYRREAHDGAAHSHKAPRRAPPAPPQQAAAARSRNAATFVVGHGKRQLRFGPIVFWTIVGSLVIMAGWSIVTATYFAFRDDVLARLISKQAEMQTAYEDRIAEMRAQVDRVTSRQLLDQEQFEQKLEQLVRRQATLESRATTLGTFAEPATTGSVKPAARGEQPSNAATKPAATEGAPTAPDRGASLEPRGFSAIVARFTGRPSGGGITGALKRVQDSLDRIEARQAGVLNTLEENVEGKARRMRGVLAELGLPVAKPPEATGGPFVPLRLPGDGFERQLQRIHVARAHLDRLSRTLVTVPVRRPVQGELDLSSGFGVRVDPFIGRPAMHTGLDFRGDTGDPVRATAAGSVTHAGYSGGYGKMVEIDHGNGLSTRYGHLSEINVSVGQNVKIGQVVGKIGSTGRSTGPHLHYETRSDGDAVDPQKFLRAGAKLGLGS